MGQQPRSEIIMNPSTPARSPGYHQKAMEEIQNSLRPFAKSSNEAMSSSAASTISNFSATSGVSSLSSTSGGGGSNVNDKDIIQLRQLGYPEVSNLCWSRSFISYSVFHTPINNFLYYFLRVTWNISKNIDPSHSISFIKWMILWVLNLIGNSWKY